MKTRFLLPLIALFTLLAFSSVQAAKDTHREQVEELFKLTQMEKRINQSVDSIVQLQIRQKPDLEKKKDKLTAFISKHIGWKAIKDDLADMYMKTFSEEDLKTINTFYSTPAGKKMMSEVPGLVQKRNKLAMKRLQDNFDELKKIIE